MPWRNAQALHIFAPLSEPYGDNWVEQILGTIVKPLHQQYADDVGWLWVTRYSRRYTEETPPENCHLPVDFRSNGWYRYVLLRVSAQEDSEENLHERAIQLAREAGCYTDPRGWIDYDVIADLGCNRFVREQANPDERARRAQRVGYFVDATVRLMLDLLVQAENGIWRFEPSTHQQNPKGSVFESVHHLFCNATQTPTTVLLSHQDSQLGIQTYSMRHPKWIALEPGKDWQHEVLLQY